ncbi:MAG TPA: DUF465 domain-containing protein [Azospirillaceae bacterium]|nr:DUF465 domain-containing protein [Azospirillaceae bacterium]
MAVEDRIESLRRKHHDLDEALHKEYARPYPDDNTLSKIKREKLRLKEEMDRLAHAH